MSITIRKATVEDCVAITELSLRSKQSNGYDDGFMAACRDELTVTPERLTVGEYWVAEDHVLYGCVCLALDKNQKSAEIHAFFIAPEYQRKGIGRRLWQQLTERATALGVNSLRLDADPAAVPFYQQLGFSVAGESPSGSIAGRSLPHMTMALSRTNA